MEIEKLIEQLRDAGWTNPGVTDKQSLEWDAADALSTLQTENEKLRAELKSKVDLVFQQAKELDRRYLLLQEQEAELEQVKRELSAYKELGPIDRLRELKQAGDEGRCVVLPFKPPRWVYMCSARFPKPAKAHYASAINVLQDMDNGCVFGDTPKEAEDALRREQDG